MRSDWDKEPTLITEEALSLEDKDQMLWGQSFNLQLPWLSTGMLTHLLRKPIQWAWHVDKSTHVFSEALGPRCESGQMCRQGPDSWSIQQRPWAEIYHSCFMDLYRDILYSLYVIVRQWKKSYVIQIKHVITEASHFTSLSIIKKQKFQETWSLKKNYGCTDQIHWISIGTDNNLI